MARGAYDILFNEDGTYKTTEQYLAEMDAAESAEMMADSLILDEAVKVLDKWRVKDNYHANVVAAITCQMLSAEITLKLLQRGVKGL